MKVFRDRGEPQKTVLKTDRDEVMLNEIRRSLSRVANSPVEAYAIALEILRAPEKPLTRGIIKGLEDIVRSLARDSLRDRELESWDSEMGVKHGDYLRFTGYHCRCRILLVKFLATGELIESTGHEWFWYNTMCGVCPIRPQSNVVSSATLGVAKYPTVWWVAHWERVVAAVGETPCEGPFEDETIWEDTLRVLAKECPTCHGAAAREFPIFRAELVNAVAKIVDSVCIPFAD